MAHFTDEITEAQRQQNLNWMLGVWLWMLALSGLLLRPQPQLPARIPIQATRVPSLWMDWLLLEVCLRAGGHALIRAAQTGLCREECRLWGLGPGVQSLGGLLPAATGGPLPVICYTAGETCWGTLPAEMDAQSKSRGDVEPYTQQPIENPCSSRTPSPPNHPLLGIRIKTTDTQMELTEVQLTQGEPWAWGLFESCPGDVLDSQGWESPAGSTSPFHRGENWGPQERAGDTLGLGSKIYNLGLGPWSQESLHPQTSTPHNIQTWVMTCTRERGEHTLWPLALEETLAFIPVLLDSFLWVKRWEGDSG